MAWSNSKVFTIPFSNMLDATQAQDLDANTFNVTLWDNTITPDQTVAAASSAYNTGVWVISGSADVFEATPWPQVGRPLVTPDITNPTTTSIRWDAADTASADATADLANVYGCHIYNDTATTPVADIGVCYIYFGGANSVVNGTFTIVWSASGIFEIAV